MAKSDKILTTVVHAGVSPEPVTGAVMTPIFQTSTFVQSEPGVHRGYDYSRADNPTRETLEKSLAGIEGADHALSFSSGLAAEQAIIQTLNPGDKVLVCDDVYGGTGRLFRTLFAKFGIEFEFINMGDHKLVESMADDKTALIWVESPSNPTMKVIDIRFMSSVAKRVGAKLVVDNTFASPIFQRPLEMGADIVMHSTTKYIGGHSDIIGGALMLNDKELYQSLKYVQFAAGAVPGPIECFLLLRSIKTLGVRMYKHYENAKAVAAFLADHPKVSKIYFPGHESHPNFELAKSQMSGHSGMISFDHAGSYEDVVEFFKRLKVFTLAESLGGVESLVNHPEKMTHASVPEELRKKLGIGPKLIRLSVGIEDAEDIIEDLSLALS